MRRFFAATCLALALGIATPVHAQPFATVDLGTWIDEVTAWFADIVTADKDDLQAATEPPADEDEDSAPLPEDSARGTIDGNG